MTQNFHVNSRRRPITQRHVRNVDRDRSQFTRQETPSNQLHFQLPYVCVSVHIFMLFYQLFFFAFLAYFVSDALRFRNTAIGLAQLDRLPSLIIVFVRNLEFLLTVA